MIRGISAIQAVPLTASLPNLRSNDLLSVCKLFNGWPERIKHQLGIEAKPEQHRHHRTSMSASRG